MTPFDCTVVYTLSAVDRGALEASGWVATESLDRLRRRSMTGVPSGALTVTAAEVVCVEVSWSSVTGYLVVHLAGASRSCESEAMAELGRLARPSSPMAQALISALCGQGARAALDSRRAATLALTDIPADDPGTVGWAGANPLERRMVSLIVLRDGRIEVEPGFDVRTERPTPSYTLAGSGGSTVVARLRPVEEHHRHILRGRWTDLYIAEISRHHALHGLADHVQESVQADGKRDWPGIEAEWHRWRTIEHWQIGQDRALEQALTRRIRAELGSDRLADRIETEIATHSLAVRTRTELAMTRAVLLLAVVAGLVPLLLQMAQDGAGSPRNVYFDVAAVISLVVGALALLSIRAGIGRGS